MSIAATKWVWDQLDIGGAEKLVLLRLADHAAPDGTSIRPGRKSVAMYCGLSERQVERYIQGFLDRGLIAYQSNEKGGRGKVPEFYIPTVKGDADDALYRMQRATPMTPLLKENATSTVVKGDIQGKERATPMTDNGGDSFKEPSKEPSRTVMARAKKGAAKKTTIPDSFGINDRLQKWAAKSGFTVEQMESQLERFKNNAAMKDNRYADWDAAFQNWMSNARDWGHLRTVPDGSMRVFNGGNNGSPRGNSMAGFDAYEAELDAQMNGHVDEPDDVIDVKVNAR